MSMSMPYCVFSAMVDGKGVDVEVIDDDGDVWKYHFEFDDPSFLMIINNIKLYIIKKKTVGRGS